MGPVGPGTRRFPMGKRTFPGRGHPGGAKIGTGASPELPQRRPQPFGACPGPPGAAPEPPRASPELFRSLPEPPLSRRNGDKLLQTGPSWPRRPRKTQNEDNLSPTSPQNCPRHGPESIIASYSICAARKIATCCRPYYSFCPVHWLSAVGASSASGAVPMMPLPALPSKFLWFQRCRSRPTD